MTAGLMNKQIADRLGASINTVKTHRTEIFRKMGAHSLLELARMMDVLREEDAIRGATHGSNGPRIADTQVTTGPIRVLVVEDSQTLREVMVAILSKRGYEVVAIPNGEGLEQALAECPVDVALLDILLGEGQEDGYALAARLRQHSRCGIIMTTALGEREDRIRGLDEGADAYLVKPIDFDELEAMIRSLLRRLQTAAP